MGAPLAVNLRPATAISLRRVGVTMHKHLVIIFFRMPIFIFIFRETCKEFEAVEIRFGPLK